MLDGDARRDCVGRGHEPDGVADMAGATDARELQGSEPSIAELVKQLSEQTTRLARQEVELAKAELAVKGKRAGIG